MAHEGGGQHVVVSDEVTRRSRSSATEMNSSDARDSEDDDDVNMNGDCFTKQVSVWSNLSRHCDLEQLMSEDAFSRQCTEIDEMASNVIGGRCIEEAIQSVAQECKFCVSIGDPRREDCPLIAVSDEFQVLTGYKRDEIVGRNCRILNRNCLLEPEEFTGLRRSCMTGESFTKIIVNRRKSGELFLNLVDLRGLVVAVDPRTGKDLWFLVGIQADVTNIAEADMPQDHLPSLHQVASRIREKISEELSTLAVSGAMLADAKARQRGDASTDTWWLSPDVGFRPVEEDPCALELSEDLEDLQPEDHFATASGDLPAHGGLAPTRQVTLSEVSFADFDDGALQAFMRQQSAAIERTKPCVMNAGAIQEAIEAAIAECRFVATIGDPMLDDCPLIAVSDGFEAMSGYRREEIIGKNCRFLSRSCMLPARDTAALRESCRTGAPFTKVLLNRRKSGDLFYNLLDLRGLTVARNPVSGQDLWFIVGIQADVTHLNEEDIPEDHLRKLQQVATDIRAQIAQRLSMMAVAGRLAAGAKLPGSREPGHVEGYDLWCPVMRARWRPGEQLALPRSRQVSSEPRSRQASSMAPGSRQASSMAPGSRQASSMTPVSRQATAAPEDGAAASPLASRSGLPPLAPQRETTPAAAAAVAVEPGSSGKAGGGPLSPKSKAGLPDLVMDTGLHLYPSWPWSLAAVGAAMLLLAWRRGPLH